MKGVLLVNLGSPDSTKPEDVKSYLDEFLMDPRVIDIPKVFRSLIVRGIILNTRPKKSAEAYKKIWWNEGSPLIVLSERFCDKIREKITAPVALAMRYGSMSIEKGLQSLADQGVDEVLVIPLYPHFAMSTTETVKVKAEEVKKEKFPDMALQFLPAFYKENGYIRVLSKSIKETLQEEEYDHILFSYHGVPESHIKKRDITESHCKIDKNCCYTDSIAHEYCYRHQCLATTELVAKELGLKEGTYSNSFQSRLGIDPWLTPFTDKTIKQLGESGVKSLAVVTPAFVSDCLETLEEIAMEGKEIFEEAGGQKFKAIPCLNDQEEWVEEVVHWIEHWRIVDVKTAIT